jgi:putative ABC transport system permease protein
VGVNFIESIKVALSALAANKLRSLLTMLGVIIGVGAVIIMVSIIQGARKRAIESFQGSGSDILFAFYAPKGEARRGGRFEGLTLDDVEAIERRVQILTVVSPELQASARALRGTKSYTGQAVGGTVHYPTLTAVKLDGGRFFDQADLDSSAKVCVLGVKVKEALFGKGESPIGQTIQLQVGGMTVPVTVVGLLKRKGNEGFGTSADERVIMPITTVQRRLTGARTVAGINARARPGLAEEAADQVFTVLKQRYPDRANDFIVDTQEGLIKQLDRILGIFQVVLGGVGGLSLLVGGIGIMNIMLVSVTERTKEIGIRKAIGAKRADILLQFITESVVVSGLGGLLGVAFGWGLSTAIGSAAPEQLSTYTPPWAIAIGFSFAMGVGMFFGIYPAVRASRLDPIQALRYE